MSEKKKVKETKKAYEKPAVIHRQVMEAIAGSCPEEDPINGKEGVGDMCTTINS